MDSIYGTAIAWAAPVFLVAVIAEIMVDRRRATRYYTLPDAVTGVACGTAFIGARISFGFIGLVVYEFLEQRVAPVRLPATHWGVWLFAFIFYDFLYYWWHRFSHEVAFLWGAHVVHHQSEQFNLTTALRQPAAGFLTAWIFYVPLALCGVPLTVYLAVGVAQLLYQFWPHTRHIGRLGVLDRWIQTPSNHRVHHACNGNYLDKNYVGVFLVWDRMFGTFEEERDDTPCLYGVTSKTSTWNPLWVNLHYYWLLASDSWHTRRWRDKLRVWVAPPGWRPADLPPRPHAPAKLTDKRTLQSTLYALAQFTAVIAGNQYFLLNFTRQDFATNAGWFALVLAGLTTVSVILEGRRDLYPLEIARHLATALVFASYPAVLLFELVSLVWFALIWAKARPVGLHSLQTS